MPRILVVDDNSESRYLLEVLLKGSGYGVSVAGNGAEALDSALADPPDLVISDLLMPIMDGFSLCHAWKSNDKLAAIPLILYTATYTDQKDEDLALSLGADRFVIKPQEPEALVQIIREVLSGARAVGKPNEVPQAESVLTKGYSKVVFHKLEQKMAELKAKSERLERTIAERERAEERTEHLNRVLRAIRRVNQLIVREKNRASLVQQACETLVETRGFDAAWIVLTDRLPEGLESGQAGIPEPAFSRFTSLFRAGTLPRCCRTGQSQDAVAVTRDTRASCPDCPLVGLNNGTCVLTASLRHEEHHYGFLGVSVSGSLEIDEQELSLLKEVGGDLGFALHGIEHEEAQRESEQSLREANERLQEAQQRLAQQTRWVQELNSVARDIARRDNLESIFRVVMHYLEESFAFATAGIALVSQDGSYYTFVALSSRGRSLARRLGVKEGTRLLLTQSFLPDLGASPEAVIFPLADFVPAGLSEPAVELFSRFQSSGLQAMVVVPLAADDVQNGTLFMLYRQAVSLSEAELEFLRGMAEYVSLALHNRSMYDELEGSYKQLQATQQAMMHQERLKAMGQMASGIAHDINNTLAPITLYTEALAAGELGRKEPARRYLGTIQSAVRDIVGITTRLRSFYKDEEQGEMEVLHIRELFDSVLELSRPRWKDIPNRQGVEIRMEREVPSRLPSFLGNLTEVREALINLVFNAADALPQGGTITLRARKQANRLCVEVADTGTGMNDEEKLRCLEPFYTTKGAEGTGLGLSMVFGTMQRHNGDLQIESEPGQGTTVRLLFPLPPRRRKQPGPDKPRPDPAPAPQRILCVEDEPKVREALKEMLVQNGHQVQACADGEKALAVFQSCKAGFDLVVTDLGMPHMDGNELARRIKELSPGTPVILLSGWGNIMNLNGELPQNVDCVLGKPPTMARLLEAIRGVLNSTKPDRPQGMSE